MQRTNIFLTEEQQKRLQRRASEEGVSKSRLIRRILDEALAIVKAPVTVDEAVRATAGIWADRTRQELDDVVKWRSETPLERLAE